METYLKIPINVNGVTYALEGQLTDQENFFGVSIEDVNALIEHISGNDSNLKKIITEVLPNKMTFGLRIKSIVNSEGAKIKTFEIIGEYDNILIQFVTGINVKGSYFHIILKNNLSFTNFPLVGEFVSSNIGISNLEFIYELGIKEPVSDKDIVDAEFKVISSQRLTTSKSDSEANVEDQKKDNHSKAKNNGADKDGNDIPAEKTEPQNNTKTPHNGKYKFLLDFNTGSTVKRYIYESNPAGKSESGIKATDESKQGAVVPNQPTPASGTTPTSANSSTPSPQAKPSVVEVTDFSPSMVKDGFMISVNAGLNIGAFKFQVIGLSVTIPFAALYKLDYKAMISDMKFGIKGIGLSYHTPTFKMDGAFYREVKESHEEYNGILNIKAGKIQVAAVGSYVKTKTFSSLFAFGYVGIPIPVHPAFNIHGLAVGFGLNRTFNLPSPSEIPEFPLIKVMNEGGLGDDTPSGFFVKLNKYVSVKENSYVIMAGVKFDTFKVVTTTVIASVTVGSDTVIGLIGITKMPKVGAYNIELSFVASYSFNQGLLDIRAELTNSFILMPQFQLQGSVALLVWFKGSNAGDFVFSIGGYHPRYKVPGHYPVNLKRLSVGANLGIVRVAAEVYFALTPACIMAGIYGGIYFSAGLDLGFAEVSFTIEIEIRADFLISWDPFYYDAAISVAIRGSIKLRFLCFSKTVKFGLSAHLHITGPDFAGVGYFEVLGYEIPVEFGNGKRLPSFTRMQFINKYFSNHSEILTTNITNGIVKKVGNLIVVNPKEFELEINSKIPLITINNNRISSKSLHPAHDYSTIPLDSNLTILCEVDTNAKDVHTTFISTSIKQSVPTSIWRNDTTGLVGKVQIDAADKTLIKDVVMGVKLEFVKIESIVQTTPASLYDRSDKQFEEEIQPLNLSLNNEASKIEFVSIFDDVQIDVDDSFINELNKKYLIYSYD